MTACLSHPLVKSRYSVAILASLAVFGPLSIDLYLPALPQIGQALASGPGQMQWTLTAFLAGFCLSMLIYGPLSDALGRRGVMLFGIVVFSLASLACALVPSAPWLIGLRFVQAAGGGAAVVMTRAIVRDIYPREDCARILSLMALATALTPMLAPLVGSEILAAAGWRAIFVTLALYGAAIWALAWSKIPESHASEHRTDAKLISALSIYATLLVDRAAWGCVLCAGGTFAAMFAYIAGTPYVYIEYFGASPRLYAVLFGINIVSQIIGTYANSRLVRSRSLVSIARAAAAIAFAGAAALLVAALTGWGGLAGVAAPLLLVIGVTVVQSSNMTARMMALYPNNAGAAAAALTSSMFGLGAVSSLLVSLLNDGAPWAMAVVVFLCCAGALIGASSLFMKPASPCRS